MFKDRRKSPASALRRGGFSFRGRRSGVSSLELVLALPLLLFVTALIINFGTDAAWKVRSLVASRNAIWQSRWPRGAQVPPPVAWSPIDGATPTLANGGAAPLTVLDDPTLEQPIARGPLPGATVNANLLDPTLGPVEGTAALTMRQPLPPHIAPVTFNVNHVLLGSSWTYDEMGMSSNTLRRTQILYSLAQAPASLSQAFIAAVAALWYAPFRPALVPLQSEPDFPRFGSSSPDFQPVLSGFCGLDANGVRAVNVQNLIDRIQGNKADGASGVPKTMTQAYLNLYNGALNRLQNMLNQKPPLPDDQQAQIRQQLAALHAELDPLIAQLNEFLATL